MRVCFSFRIVLEICPKCGGPLKIIAAIEQPNAIQKILTHLGLQAHPPPRAPARYDPEREADIYQTPAMLHASVHSATAPCVSLPPPSMAS